MSKRIVIPVIALVALVIAFILVVKYSNIETIESGFTQNTVKLDFVQTKCVYPVTVNDAEFQVQILLTNRGVVSTILSRVYVNQKEVDIYGLDHGGTLINGSHVGTSISEQGLRIDPGKNYEVYIWIGDNMFSSGSQIIIQFNDPNSITMMKSITLN